MSKKIIICANGGGSGKDYLRRKFEKKRYSFGVHYTTRPKRNDEVEGVDYYYINEKFFKELIKKNLLIEYSIHNGWYYGLSKDEFEEKDLFILSLKSYIKYPLEIRNNIFKIFLDIDENVRRDRLSKRNDSDTVDRRISSDFEDMKYIDIKEFDLVIKNENF